MAKNKQSQKNEKVKNGLENEFEEIYNGLEETDQDMSKMQQRKKDRLKSFLIGAIIVIGVLAVVSWAGYFLTAGSKGGFEKESVTLEISTLEQTESATKITYYVKYVNNDRAELKDTELEVKFPAGFIYESASIEPDEQRQETNTFVWNLGEIRAGLGDRIEINGMLLGDLDADYTISGHLSYTPRNFNSPFTKQASAQTKITGSALDIKLDGPDKIATDEDITYKITYENTSEQDLENVKIVFQTLGIFKIDEIDRGYDTDESSIESGEYVWIIDKLEAKQQAGIEFTGQYLREQDTTNIFNLVNEDEEQEEEIEIPESVDVSVSIYITDKDENYYLQKQEIIETEFVTGDLGVGLIINGANESKAVDFGSNLSYSIVLKNKGDKKMEDIQVELLMESNPEDLVDIDDVSARAEDNKLVWTKKEYKNITFLDPAEEITIDFSLSVKDVSDLKDISSYSDKNFKVANSVKAIVSKIGTTEVSQEFESNSVEILVNSDLEFDSEAKYIDDNGELVGSGPYPPQSGQKTTFKVYWTIINHLHEIKDIKITAKVPDGIDWTGEYKLPGGNIDYNNVSRIITWSLNRIPVDYNKMVITFDLGFTPDEEDVGTTVKLLENASLEATDKETSGSIKVDTNFLTTDLDGAEGGGEVVY